MQRTDPPASSIVGTSTATIVARLFDHLELIGTQRPPGARRHREQSAVGTGQLERVAGELAELLRG